MFGVDWDGDGEEGLLDDIITMDILDGEDDLRGGNSRPTGSCLVFLIMIGTAVALPIAGLVKLLV